MYMNPAQAYMTQPNTMAGGPQGFIDPRMSALTGNYYGGALGGVGSTPYATIYDNPMASFLLSDLTNIRALPRSANYYNAEAHMSSMKLGLRGASMASKLDIGGELVGGLLGAAYGTGVGGFIGSIAGSVAGTMIGGAMGDTYEKHVEGQMATHRSLMGLANQNSPYGVGAGYNTKDAMKIYSNIENMAADDAYFSAGDITRILDEGIKTGNIQQGSTTDITSRLKGLKETAKKLVEIFGSSNITEIFDNLRRIQSGGMTESEAVEASAITGVAARALGMNSKDLLNINIQDAKSQEVMGTMDFSSALSSKSGMTAILANDPTFKKYFGTNDRTFAALKNTEEKLGRVEGVFGSALLNSFDAPSVGFVKVASRGYAKQIAKERGLDMTELSLQERSDLDDAGFKRYTERVRAIRARGGKAVDVARELKEGGNINEKTMHDLIQNNVAALSKNASEQGITFGAKTDMKIVGAVRAKEMDALFKNPALAAAVNTNLTTDDRKIAEGFAKMSQGVAGKYTDRELQNVERSALRKAGAVDSQLNAIWQKFAAGFSQSVDKILGDIDKHKMGSVGTVKDMTKSGASEFAFAAQMTPVQFSKMNELGTPSMMAGDQRKSILGRVAALIGDQSSTELTLQGIAGRAGLNGIGQWDSGEILKLVQSGRYSQDIMGKSLSKIMGTYDKLSRGEISVGDMDPDSTVARHTRFMELNDISSAGFSPSAYKDKTDLNLGEMAIIKNSGLIQTMSANLISRYNDVEEDTANMSFVDIGGREWKELTDSTIGIVRGRFNSRGREWKELTDSAQVLMRQSYKEEDRNYKILKAGSKVNFDKLSGLMSKLGAEAGVEAFVDQSTVDDEIKDPSIRSEFKKSLIRSGGSREGFMKDRRLAAISAERLRSSGKDLNSALLQVGIRMDGKVNVEQVKEYASYLQNQDEDSDAVRLEAKYRGVSMADAARTMHAQGKLLAAHANEIAATSQAQGIDISALFKKIQGDDYGKLTREIFSDEGKMSTVASYSTLSKDRRAAVVAAAKDLNARIGGKNKEIVAAHELKAFESEHQEGMTAKERKIATELARWDNLEDIDMKDLDEAGKVAPVVNTAVVRARKIFGSNLISDEEQQTAVGMIDTLFSHSKERGWSSISTAEMHKKYKAALGKKEEERTVGDLALLKGMELAQGMTGKDAKEVTTKEVVSALSTDMGQAGMSAEKITSNLNQGGDSGGVISVLERIKGSLDELVRITARKAGAKSKIKVGDDSNTTLKFSDIDRTATLPPKTTIKERGLTESQKQKLADVKKEAAPEKHRKLSRAEIASNTAARIARGKAWRAQNKTASGVRSLQGMRNALGTKFTSTVTAHTDSNIKEMMKRKTEEAADRRRVHRASRGGVERVAERRRIIEAGGGPTTSVKEEKKARVSEASRQLDKITNLLEGIKQAISSKEKVITSGTQN
jgi:hypothetical protein